MQGLEQLLTRLKSYQEMPLYNKKVVEPYHLASQGLIFSYKQQEGTRSIPIARCQDPRCSLIIQFDTLDAEEQPKDDIESAVLDHDAECPFSQNPPIKVDANLFRNLGPALFQQRIDNIHQHQKFIQLSPKEVRTALGLPQGLSSSPPHQVNLTLQLFRKLDRRLSSERLTKVRSAIFLALFGWQFSESGENEMVCRFCATTRNVFEFLSPSECTLMGLPVGFDFISAHRPWCCLIRPGKPLWRETLKQVVLKGLQRLEGQVSRSESEMKCKEIQDNAVRRYAGHYSQWTTQRRRLEDLKNTIQTNYPEDSQEKSEIRSAFLKTIHNLESSFQSCRETVQTFIKRIKLT